MTYSVEYASRFEKEFRKLDRYTQKLIKAWIMKNLRKRENPRKGLAISRSGQWRYRIGNYRLICQIEDDRLVILALSVPHRKEVHKS